jgi:hypothetical protein
MNSEQGKQLTKKFLLSRRCRFCKKKSNVLNGTLELQKEYGSYGTIYDFHYWYWYHEKCLYTVLCDPESYDNLTVDIAIHIVYLHKLHKQIKIDNEKLEKEREEKAINNRLTREREEREKRRESIELAKQYCRERNERREI